MTCRPCTHGRTHRVTTEGTLSGFQIFFLQPIIKDQPQKNELISISIVLLFIHPFFLGCLIHCLCVRFSKTIDSCLYFIRCPVIHSGKSYMTHTRNIGEKMFTHDFLNFTRLINMAVWCSGRKSVYCVYDMWCLKIVAFVLITILI